MCMCAMKHAAVQGAYYIMAAIVVVLRPGRCSIPHVFLLLLSSKMADTFFPLTQHGVY